MVHVETHHCNGAARTAQQSTNDRSMSKRRTEFVFFARAPAMQFLVTTELAGRQLAASLCDAPAHKDTHRHTNTNHNILFLCGPKTTMPNHHRLHLLAILHREMFTTALLKVTSRIARRTVTATRTVRLEDRFEKGRTRARDNGRVTQLLWRYR